MFANAFNHSPSRSDAAAQLLHGFEELTGSERNAPADAAAEEALILRSLIEEFGGEVMTSDLGRRLAPRMGWSFVEFDTRLRATLETLARAGAVSLEAAGFGNLTVRLDRQGLERAGL